MQFLEHASNDVVEGIDLTIELIQDLKPTLKKKFYLLTPRPPSSPSMGTTALGTNNLCPDDKVMVAEVGKVLLHP
jgi:hypothetical protein